MPHSSPHSLGCPQWAPTQDGNHPYLSLLWLLASDLGIGWTPSFRHLRRLWQEGCWTGERRLFGLLFHPPASKTPPEPMCEVEAQPASRRRAEQENTKLALGSWSISGAGVFSSPCPLLCLSLPSRKQHCGSTHQQTDQGERTDQ